MHIDEDELRLKLLSLNTIKDKVSNLPEEIDVDRVIN